ncbi:class II histocompatibility antigen, B-L beta chain-like [Pipra filicauda]|uniref:Class II histocompatibility antigen, B-L beta chain-like n=1 Tax=Pipra filicauda TaxID=649802 RepID=A0A7R5L6D5_9PASS|nr:class II histocompatibility antigen, B-L beta chain-like [Pipra filicauda]
MERLRRGVFQRMFKAECHFINGTERVRFMERHIYNREQQLQFDSDLGVYVGDTPFGEIQARNLNSLPGRLEYTRSAVDTYCWPYYELDAPFSMERRGERGAERVPLSPAPGMTLEPLKPSLGIKLPPDTVRSKILVGVGGFVLGLVFLALGLGFYLREKSS